MIARSGSVAVVALMLTACAVPMPPEYMGIATAAPVPAETRAQIAAAAGRTGLDAGCPWADGDGKLNHVPCALLPVSQLAGFAWSGNKPAALELGMRFEEGRGVPQDFDKARALYRTAATTTGGDLWFYSPGVGDHPGQVLPLHIPQEPGLPEARRRLALLETWRARQDNPEAHECPALKTGLSDLAARPSAPDELVRLADAIAEGRLGRGACLWQAEAQRLTTIPCTAVPLPTLAQMAQGGDREALFELASRFEKGQGTGKDLAQAEALYCAAGQTTISAGGYAPPTADAPPRWVPLSGTIGLPKAERRSERLRRARREAAR